MEVKATVVTTRKILKEIEQMERVRVVRLPAYSHYSYPPSKKAVGETNRRLLQTRERVLVKGD